MIYRLLLSTLALVLVHHSSAHAGARVVFSGEAVCRQVALTFDTEFQATVTPQLLNVLEAQGVKATFFLVGQEVNRFPELTARIAASHELGNHTHTHPPLTDLSAAQIAAELNLADEAITAATGRAPRPTMRPPYGFYNQTVLDVAEQTGYPWVVHWSMAPDETATVGREVSDILEQAFPGGIALFHGWTRNTPPALEIAIPELRRRGYQFVTVTEVLGINRGARDWGGTPVHVQAGETVERLGFCYNTPPPFLAAYNNLTGEPAPGAVLTIPRRDEVIIHANGVRLSFDIYPRLVGSRTVAPLRQVAEALGAQVTWLPETARVRVAREGRTLIFSIGSPTAVVDGVPTTMELPASLLSGRTMVPLRFVAEHLGATVAWAGSIRTVTLTQ